MANDNPPAPTQSAASRSLRSVLLISAAAVAVSSVAPAHATTVRPRPEPTQPPVTPTAPVAPVMPSSPTSRGIVRDVATTGSTTAAASVTITSHAAGAKIDALGATLKGRVAGSLTDIVSLELQVGGKPATTRTVEVNLNSGEFAYRLFAADLVSGTPVTVTATLKRTAGTETASFTYTPVVDLKERSVGLAVSRMSYGWTADLQRKIESQGFDAWVKAQLDPDRQVPESRIGKEPWASMQTNLLTKPWGTTTPGAKIGQWTFDWKVNLNQMFVASYTDQQLREVMAQFWRNHFWTIQKGSFWYATVGDYKEAEQYRKLALGSFKDLLFASAQNGVMMGFLDNASNNKNRRNENYAREIMELHTVSSKAGYKDVDITAVAKVLTGWGSAGANDARFDIDTGSPDRKFNDVVFKFYPDRHDTTDKTIPFLNMTIKGRSGEAGVDEGKELINALANHPMTKSHICGELAQLLVSDNPPDATVARCVTAWGDKGIVADLIGAIVLSPDFLQTVDVNTKVKSPFEYSVAVIRNFGLTPKASDPAQLFAPFSWMMNSSGMNLMGFSLPTGFDEDSSAWLGQAGLVARINGVGGLFQNTSITNIDYGSIPGLSRRVRVTEAAPPVTIPDAATAEAGAAGILGYLTNDRYTREEYDAVVAALTAAKGGFVNPADFEQRTRKAMRLVVALPSYLLQ